MANKKNNWIYYVPLFLLIVIDIFWKKELKEFLGNYILIGLYAIGLLVPLIKEFFFTKK